MHRSSDEDDGTWVPDSPPASVERAPFTYRQFPRGGRLTAIAEDSVAETEESTWTSSGPRGTRRRRPEPWKQLKNLEHLFDLGYINEAEYNERKQQLVDQLTGTRSVVHGGGTRTMTRTSLTHASLTRTSTVGSTRKRTRRRRRDLGLLQAVMSRSPGDFSDLPTEEADQHVFENGVWTRRRVRVRVDPTPFAKGGLRLVYYMQVVEVLGEDETDSSRKYSTDTAQADPATVASATSRQAAGRGGRSASDLSVDADVVDPTPGAPQRGGAGRGPVAGWAGLPRRRPMPGRVLGVAASRPADVGESTVPDRAEDEAEERKGSDTGPCDAKCGSEDERKEEGVAASAGAGPTAGAAEVTAEAAPVEAPPSAAVATALDTPGETAPSAGSSGDAEKEAGAAAADGATDDAAKAVDAGAESGDASADELDNLFVIKVSIEHANDVETYFRDVEMQTRCGVFAAAYNSYAPPRKVEFVKCWVLQLLERRSVTFCHMEPYIHGRYHKHNNNFGYVDPEVERNTPQSFSHFTFEASNCRMLVVDIQGVGDLYTDPQVHTLSEDGFSRGNLGRRGVERFLQTHRCNRICRFLHLTPVNPKDARQDTGTLPAQPFMAKTQVDVVRVDNVHAYETTPHLSAYFKSRTSSRRRGGRGRGDASAPLLTPIDESAAAPGGAGSPSYGAVDRHGRRKPGRGPADEEGTDELLPGVCRKCGGEGCKSCTPSCCACVVS